MEEEVCDAFSSSTCCRRREGSSDITLFGVFLLFSGIRTRSVFSPAALLLVLVLLRSREDVLNFLVGCRLSAMLTTVTAYDQEEDQV